MEGEAEHYAPELAKEDLDDLVTIGRYRLQQGTRDFAAWSKAMAKDIGEGVNPHLALVWQQMGQQEPGQETSTTATSAPTRRRTAAVAGTVWAWVRTRSVPMSSHSKQVIVTALVVLCLALALLFLFPGLRYTYYKSGMTIVRVDRLTGHSWWADPQGEYDDTRWHSFRERRR